MIWCFEVENQQYQISGPLTLSEITFEQYIDFVAAEQKFLKAVQIKTDEDTDDSNLIKELDSNKWDTGFNFLLDSIMILFSGDVQFVPVSVLGDDLAGLLNSGWVFRKPGEDISLERLYAHITNLILQYKPTEIPRNFSYTWEDGYEYSINAGEAIKLVLGTGVTTGEVVTILEFQRQAQKAIDKLGDEEGNLQFNLGLREMAILCRRKDERLPAFRNELYSFIDERAPIFRSWPMDVVLNVRFFLLNTFAEYTKTLVINTFLNQELGLGKPVPKIVQFLMPKRKRVKNLN